MAGVSLLALTAGLLLQTCGNVAAVTGEQAGSVFVSQRSADTVLRRHRRFNSGHLEEMMKDNLERECIEEKCSPEEAREVFENDEKTMEFLAGYLDGDQCDPHPCQNGGSCEDGISAYICWCQPNFDGKNCEIEVTKQCLVANGGCSHFCAMQSERAVCQCAAGYKLGPDMRSCLPTEQFSCGRVNLSSDSDTGSILSVRSSRTNVSDSNLTSSDLLLDEYFLLNETYQYDDYNEVSAGDLDQVNASVASAVDPHSMKSDPSSNGTLSDAVMIDVEATEKEEQEVPYWASPTLPTVVEAQNVKQRVVGGEEAKPGEIPWQVLLVSNSKDPTEKTHFCGGSLLSAEWVITAAHCLTPLRIVVSGFFVRIGDHDKMQQENTERDYMVAEQLIHPFYDASKSEYNHDIALLKLAAPVEMSNKRRPICLGPKDFTENLLRDSRSSIVSGWGKMSFTGPQASKLQKLAVPYIDRTKCKASSSHHITRFMFCAGYENEPMDTCLGDSGGPHATNFEGTWFLTGIVSWGEECAKQGKYGVYTRISRYYPWISQITGIHISK
ncbi:coagulation factor IX-like [Genypterus blacodes]|uniref:coagulation factor IX-like n=1 Tax=Genypterus blacodes TaxID=154954 RepID=UPI003F774AB5